ncbi:hypothetical protein CSE45_5497 [Citreicella sp. SE45]|nr:hypothetical protein CSE45_5497 [Citreicella sp. SE45]
MRHSNGSVSCLAAGRRAGLCLCATVPEPSARLGRGTGTPPEGHGPRSARPAGRPRCLRIKVYSVNPRA